MTHVKLSNLMKSAAMAVALLALAAPLTTAEARMRVIEKSSDMKIGVASVAQGTSETMKVDTSYTDLVVGDPDIADVVPLTDRSLYVLGKKLGRTSVSIYGADKQLLGVLDIEVSYDSREMAVELKRRLPDANIKVSSVNGHILLTGTVPDAITLDQAVLIAKQFGPEVVNSMSVDRSQQVMLEVRFLEVSRTAGRELSSRLSVTGPGYSATTGFPGLQTGQDAFGTLTGSIVSGGVNATLAVRALEEKGLARRLAEPNLVALSGDTASFLAGGEFPFPVASGIAGQVSIEFKKFGVGLSFTPTVLKDGLINLKIDPEVSELDNTQGIAIGGVQVPGLVVRRASTTVELKDGQSFAMAGLLQSVNSSDLSQLPWVGNIPILGALFRSTSFQRHETDLVIMVTPRLVRPAVPGQALHSPLDSTKRTNDSELFINGQTEEPTGGPPRRGLLNRGFRDAERTPVQPLPYNTDGHILSVTKPEETTGAIQ